MRTLTAPRTHVPAAHRVAELMAEELGRDASRINAEAEHYETFVRTTVPHSTTG